MLSFLYILASVTTISCLFEDQVGLFDWRQQYIGQVDFASFYHGAQYGKKIIVGARENVVGAINARNGELSWRQIMEEENVLNKMFHLENSVVVISGFGKTIRSFTANHGYIQWELNLSSESAKNIESIVYGSQSTNQKLAILINNQIWSIDLAAGKIDWVKSLNIDVHNVQYLLSKDDTIFVSSLLKNGKFSIISFNFDGSKFTEKTVNSNWKNNSDVDCSTLSTLLICFNAKSTELFSLDIFENAILQNVVLSSKLLKKRYTSLCKINEASDNLIGLRPESGDGFVLFKLKNSILEEFLYFDQDIIATGAKLGNEEIIIALSLKNDYLSFRFFNFLTGKEIQELHFIEKWELFRGDPLELRALLFKKKDGLISIRLFVISEDQSLSMLVRNGGMSWTREESLSSILAVEMIDLPVSKLQAEMEDEFGHAGNNLFTMFIKRLFTQTHQLFTFINEMLIKLSKSGQIGNEKIDQMHDSEYLTRDDFNLHKVIVVTTKFQKIIGIDNLTGKILWQIRMKNIETFYQFDKAILPLYLQRSTAHFPHEPICTVIAKKRGKEQSILLSFNPINGVIHGQSNGIVLNYTPIHIMLVPFATDEEILPLLIIDTLKTIHVHPTEAKNVVSDHSQRLFVYTVDSKTNILNGYSILNKHDELFAQSTWKIDLLKQNQNITNIVGKRYSERVHSQGVVLGDRNVMYKYLNPNLFAVSTEGKDSQSKPFLSIYLIDGVSGHIVYQTTHKRSSGPIQMVHSENWICYTYWSTKSRRSEMAILELYEGKEQTNLTEFSSFSPPPQPMVLNQAYIFAGHVTAMAVSITEKGITNREVILALPIGNLLSLPKMLIDPRRPLMPTAESQEEGVMPYIPELPRPYEAMVNYNQSIFRIRGIHSAPAGLESTSLILAYGLDIFYTKVMPSKTFDVLKEDFDYFFITCVVGGMIAVSIVSQKLSARKALSRAWK